MVYDKNYLIPYLQNLYSVELLYRRVNHAYEHAARQQRYYQAQLVHDKQPARPHEPKGNWILMVCLGGVLALGALSMLITMSVWSAVGIVLGGLAAQCFYLARKYLRAQKRYLRRIEQFRKETQDYVERKDQRTEHLREEAKWKPLTERLSKNRQELAGLREQLYAVGLIPGEHHNVYAVSFLYDGVRFGMAEDLEELLQSYSYLDVKKKLDPNMEQQTEFIVKQRAYLAKQERMGEFLNQPDFEAMVPETVEHFELYRRMLQCNEEVSRYFAENPYILEE